MGSAVSNVAVVTIATPAVSPPDLAAEFNPPNPEILLSWTVPAGAITNFYLYRSVDASAFELYQTLGSGITSFIDEFDAGPIDYQHVYAYYVTAAAGTTLSGPSNQVVVSNTTIDGQGPNAGPQNAGV